MKEAEQAGGKTSSASTDTVESGQVVTVSFSLFDEAGEKLHETTADDPLVYLHGSGNILPGIEEGLAGRRISERFELVLPPEKAFGVSDPGKVQHVARDAFPSEGEVTVGMQFGADDQDGSVVPVWITDVEGDQVTINGNHPYSDLTLRCEGEVLAIREATAEETDHGHVHGEGHVH